MIVIIISVLLRFLLLISVMKTIDEGEVLKIQLRHSADESRDK